MDKKKQLEHPQVNQIRNRREEVKKGNKVLAIMYVALTLVLLSALGWGMRGQISKLIHPQEEATKETFSTVNVEKAVATLTKQAAASAEQFHYDNAIKKIEKAIKYEPTNQELKARKTKYEKEKAQLVEYGGEVEHVFFHQLIVDPKITFSKANEGDWQNFNSVMTTVDEFKKMMQSMYDKGYILVRFSDIYEVKEGKDGSKKVVSKPLMLPQGRRPLIISEDDTNFYEKTTLRVGGLGQKFVFDENGAVKVEYKDADGNILVGDYDLVPVLDTFIKEHPDFSYKGAKGYIGLTGYNGVLGYRINEIHAGSQTQSDNLVADRKMVTKIAKALRKDGWEFASHSYSHGNMSYQSLAEVKEDAKWWKEEVAKYVGDTDVYLFPYGDWGQYGTGTQQKLQVLLDYGFTSFNGVGLRTYNQMKDGYFFMDRCNLDGQTMYNRADYLTKFFRVKDVWDSGRPKDSSSLKY